MRREDGSHSRAVIMWYGRSWDHESANPPQRQSQVKNRVIFQFKFRCNGGGQVTLPYQMVRSLPRP